MKTKTFLTAFLASIFSVASTLFVYTHFYPEANQKVADQNSSPAERTAPVVLTSMQSPENPVDFTYAADQTVHAVVHVRVRSTVSYNDESDNPLFQFFNGNNFGTTKKSYWFWFRSNNIS